MAWITDVVAPLALALSALSLYLQWKHTRVRLKVRPSIGIDYIRFKLDGAGGYVGKDLPVLRIHLANPTENPIHIKGVYVAFKKWEVELKHVKDNRISPVEPHRDSDFVASGNHVFHILEREDYKDKDKVRIKIKVYDEIGTVFTSKLRFVMDQLIPPELKQKPNGE